MQATTKDERTLAMLCHLLGILTGFVGPLVLWLIKKDESAFLNDQGKEALNFQITLLLAYFAAGALTIVLIGLLLIPVLFIGSFILMILAGLKANEGVLYRYPFTLRLIK